MRTSTGVRPRRRGRWNRRLAMATVLTAAAVGAPVAAHAGTAWSSSFNVSLGAAQIPYYGLSEQSKAATYQAGSLNTTFVGSSYTIDATLCIYLNCGLGTKVYGFTDGSTKNLPNTISAGAYGLSPELRVGSWNAVSVQVQGRWKSN